jgi:hypothetical protein
MDNKTKFVKQYRAELTIDPETTCTINSSTEDKLIQAVGNLLGGKPPRIEESPSAQNTTLIYHESHMNGNQPVGWIAELEVPQTMSVKNVTETRFAAQRAA